MRYIFIIFLLLTTLGHSQIKIVEESTRLPVSFATISFGNGNGIFADDAGEFTFTRKIYPDVDSLFISALGYESVKLAAANLPDVITMQSRAHELDEIIISNKTDRKFKIIKYKPYLDDDYYRCWLPTIESEIAVFIPKKTKEDQQLYKVQFPIALESQNWEKRHQKNAEKKAFSTLFKIRVYDNRDGLPGEALITEPLVFIATEKTGDYFEMNLEDYLVMIPDNGLFVSIQVLGYTNAKGKLLANKKYKEIKGPNGMVKIPTNFRPLLPFTDEIKDYRTFVKRIFVLNNQWRAFIPNNGISSTLLDKGFYNYGIGVTLKAFKD
jgi:hypothetical protein